MILLVGGGGIPNYGDELIINNWLRWYHEARVAKTRGMVVEGYRSAVLRNMFADRFPRARWSHTIRDARLTFRAQSFWDALQGGIDAEKSGVPAVQKAYGQASEASLVHVHGGGYINGKWPSHAFVLGLASAAQRSAGAAAVATGIGLSPLRDPDREQRRLLDQAVEAFDFIEVRDEWSYEYLTRNLSGARRERIILGLDDAYLYPVETATSHRTLHLALRDDPHADSIIGRLTNKFVGSFDRHIFWVCKHTDAGAYVKVANRFRFFELAGTAQLIENPRLGARDVLITERFHPHLQAARVGATGVFWAGSEYYDTKHGSLVELGSPFRADDGEEFLRIDSPQAPSEISANDPANVARKQALGRRAVKLVRRRPS